MTNEERIPTLALGFGAGVLLLSILVTGQINDLRQTLIDRDEALISILESIHILRARIANEETHVSELAQRWEDDIQTARSGPHVVIPGWNRPNRNPRTASQ